MIKLKLIFLLYAVFSAELVTMVNGRQVALLDGFSFYKKHKSGKLFKWACTSSATCKAYLKMDDDLYIYDRDPKHNHPMKNYVKTASGRYLRL